MSDKTGSVDPWLERLRPAEHPERGKDGITAFLVDRNQPGVRKQPMPGKELGHRGAGHARLVLTNARVGHEAVLGGIGNGFQVAMGDLHCGRISVAAGVVGLLRAALVASLTFSESRKPFGMPNAAFQMVQEHLADPDVDPRARRRVAGVCPLLPVTAERRAGCP